MDLNIAKCEVITFSRRTESNRHIHDYNVNHQPLRRVTVVKDLGVLLDEKMTFKVHYNQIVSRGHSMLGFVKRQAKEYECPYVTKSLYCALVRPLRVGSSLQRRQKSDRVNTAAVSSLRSEEKPVE